MRQIISNKPGRYYLGDGLVLIVTAKHNRRYAFRYTSPITKRVTETSLGTAFGKTLPDARSAALQMRFLLEKGQDPVQVKRQQRVSGITFGAVCDEWVTINHNVWSASQMENANLRLRVHGKSIIGNPIASIDADAIELALRHLLSANYQKQARRTLAMWKRVFDYAKHKKYITGDNPAEWRGNMEFNFPAPAKNGDNHYPALEYHRVPEFLKRLRILQAKSTAAVGLEMQLLTATRPGETLGAQWSEFDILNQIWTIPAERMKKGKQHRVPLSDRVMELLARRKESSRSDFVFTGYERPRHQKRMDESAMRRILYSMDVRRQDGIRVTVHGFRSSFRDWAAEQTEFDFFLVEMCLAHKVGNAVTQAYLRGDALEKRRVIMDEWAKFCDGA